MTKFFIQSENADITADRKSSKISQLSRLLSAEGHQQMYTHSRSAIHAETDGSLDPSVSTPIICSYFKSLNFFPGAIVE